MEVVQLKSEFAVDPIYVKGGYGPMDKYLLNSSLLFNDHIKAKEENLSQIICCQFIQFVQWFCKQVPDLDTNNSLDFDNYIIQILYNKELLSQSFGEATKAWVE